MVIAIQWGVSPTVRAPITFYPKYRHRAKMAPTCYEIFDGKTHIKIARTCHKHVTNLVRALLSKNPPLVALDHSRLFFPFSCIIWVRHSSCETQKEIWWVGKKYGKYGSQKIWKHFRRKTDSANSSQLAQRKSLVFAHPKIWVLFLKNCRAMKRRSNINFLAKYEITNY